MGKNWSRICDINNHNLRIAMAQISPDSDVGKKLAVALPDCFVDGEDRGKILLSLIACCAAQNVDNQPGTRMILALEEMDIPFASYATNERYYRDNRADLAGVLSADYQQRNQISFGSTILLNGHYVVVVSAGPDEVDVVPAELITVDITDDMACAA